jgi:hypothetical protein
MHNRMLPGMRKLKKLGLAAVTAFNQCDANRSDFDTKFLFAPNEISEIAAVRQCNFLP